MDAEDSQAYARQQLIDAANRFAPLAAERLELSRDDQRIVITELCIEMFNAGVRAGSSQVLAQAIEQGIDLRVNMDPNLFPNTE